MTTLRSILLFATATLTISCGGGKPNVPPTTKPTPMPDPVANTVDVAIGSVTLADDCGTGPETPPRAMLRAPVTEIGFGDSPGPTGSMRSSAGARRCEQSSVQMRIVNGTAAASTITVKTVEVLDDSGAVVSELTPREPSKWTGDRYESWDGNVAAAETLQVSYALSRPGVIHGATYTVRVVISSAEGDKTLETKTTLEAPASLPPGAVT